MITYEPHLGALSFHCLLSLVTWNLTQTCGMSASLLVLYIVTEGLLWSRCYVRCWALQPWRLHGAVEAHSRTTCHRLRIREGHSELTVLDIGKLCTDETKHDSSILIVARSDRMVSDHKGSMKLPYGYLSRNMTKSDFNSISITLKHGQFVWLPTSFPISFLHLHTNLTFKRFWLALVCLSPALLRDSISQYRF